MAVTRSEDGRRDWRYRAVSTDAARFPFSAIDRQRLVSGGIELIEISGHHEDAVAEAAHGADAVFVYSAELSRETFARFGSCRLVIRCGSGYDRIDVAAARALGITLAYVPVYGAWDVAEHTLALLFAVARRIPQADASVRTGAWPSYDELGTMHRLRGSVLGLIGFGRIARRVAKVAVALGMTVCAFDPYTPDEIFAEHAVTAVDLRELAARAQVVSLHAPLTPATAGIVDRRFLEQLRPDAILINTARGELIDEAALVAALSDGRLAGAGLDVLTTEPADPGDPLLTFPGVVLTPHSAAFTAEALASVRAQAIDEVLRAADGLPPLNPIPVSEGA